MLGPVRRTRAALGAGAMVVALALVGGCDGTVGIDGTKVPKVGSAAAPPSCAQVCARLAQLCGLEPHDCTLQDAGGYCDTLYDDAHRVCVGQAATCQIADECQNAEPSGDAGGDEASPDDAAAGEAGGDDAAAVDAATDAKGD